MKGTFAPLQVSVKFETSPIYSGTPKQKLNSKEKPKTKCVEYKDKLRTAKSI